MEMFTKEQLIAFEAKIASLKEKGEIPYYVHLSGGNEDQLIDIFKQVHPNDYVLSTHRSHYHYLLKGSSPERLEEMIMQGRSMHIIDKELKFISSAIVAGTCTTAVGIAWALKEKGSENGVYCFVGDAAEGLGHFYEAVRYVDGWKLPCGFIIEDNDRSVRTPKIERYGTSEMQWPDCVIRYSYVPTWPHEGTGRKVDPDGTITQTGGMMG